MIRPPLPRARDGDVLGLGLMNGIINRVEYAADLLRQGKPLAGNNIAVQENYNGSLISYIEIEPGDDYRLVSSGGVIYNSSLEIVLTLTAANFGTFGTPETYGVRKNYVLGWGFKDSSYEEAVGIIYNGTSGTSKQFPGSYWTEFWDIDPKNFNKIVGSYFEQISQNPNQYSPYNGLIYDLASNSWQTLNRPNQDFAGTYLTGIYNNIIIGGQAVGTTNTFYYNGSFNFLPDGFFPYGIWETSIVGTGAKIYKIGEGFIKQLSIPELGSVDATGIYKNYVCGHKTSFPFSGFVYDLNTDTYQIKFGARFWAIG